jgi:hypothetical protein
MGSLRSPENRGKVKQPGRWRSAGTVIAQVSAMTVRLQMSHLIDCDPKRQTSVRPSRETGPFDQATRSNVGTWSSPPNGSHD